jgi:GNAT superfamily N-acetyltransferase
VLSETGPKRVRPQLIAVLVCLFNLTEKMFVATPFQGRGVGRALAETLIREAQILGYTRMRLEVVFGRSPLTACITAWASSPLSRITSFRKRHKVG